MSKRIIDLKGQKFGKLTAIEFYKTDKHNVALWKCLCECGNITIVKSINLKNGYTKSCGCISRNDLTGKRFGRLVVLEKLPIEFTKSGNTIQKWKCICDCGNEINVIHSNLVKGSSKSCGCLQKELTSKRFSKHNLRSTRLYSIYANMKQRCYNPQNSSYKNYGGRGIKICSEWLGVNGFENFYNWAVLNGYKEILTIDRINNDGNYEPSNCKWSNSKEQRLNTRNNHKLTYNGKTYTIYEWSKITGINYKCILSRINYYNWSVERALTEKPLIGKNQHYRTDSLN